MSLFVFFIHNFVLCCFLLFFSLQFFFPLRFAIFVVAFAFLHLLLALLCHYSQYVFFPFLSRCFNFSLLFYILIYCTYICFCALLWLLHFQSSCYVYLYLYLFNDYTQYARTEAFIRKASARGDYYFSTTNPNVIRSIVFFY